MPETQPPAFASRGLVRIEITRRLLHYYTVASGFSMSKSPWLNRAVDNLYTYNFVSA